jgi:hypothetical protein
MEGIIELYLCLGLQFINLLIRYVYFHEVIFYVDGPTLGLSYFFFKIVFDE